MVEWRDTDNDRMVTNQFTVSSSWQRFTFAIPADTTGTVTDDNTEAFQLNFWLHAGSTYTSGTYTANAWQTETNANKAVGIDSFFDSTSNEFFLTGVQLEIGEQATPFEHRSYADELIRCQRYYQSMDYYYSYGSTSTNIFYYTNFSFPITMRATPTMTASAWGSNTGNAQTYYGSTQSNGWIMQTAIPTGCIMRGNHANIYNFMSGRGKFDAEL